MNLCETLNNAPKNGPPLDTLAQLGTNPEITDDFDVCACTSKSDKRPLLKRARRKFLSTGLTLQLVKASEGKESKSKLNKSYWNTFHCAKVLLGSSDGKITGKYCKNRWCLVCNSIRTAQLIHRYKPVLENWNDKYFVTLTIPNCKGLDLRNVIEGMQAGFNKIKEKLRKRHQRKQGAAFVGLRKLECTYNPETNTYHPHFHLIIRGEEIANEIVNSWLKIYPAANIKAQDLKSADDNSCLELFKYFTKVISKSKKGERLIYADAMDVIFNAISGKRTFQPFGFKLSKSEDVKEGEAVDITEVIYIWEQALADWIDTETGEFLTGYTPNEGMKKLVAEKIIVRTNYNSS